MRSEKVNQFIWAIPWPINRLGVAGGDLKDHSNSKFSEHAVFGSYPGVLRRVRISYPYFDFEISPYQFRFRTKVSKSVRTGSVPVSCFQI